MSKKPSIPEKEQDTVEFIGPLVEEPRPSQTATAVKPFVAPATQNAPVIMTEAVAPPLNRYRVRLPGFPSLDTDPEKPILAADADDARNKFFEKYHIVRSEKAPEITLLGQAS